MAPTGIPLAPASPDNAGEPGFCALCGRPDTRCLCRACRDAHTHGGELAEWARALQRDAQRETKRVRSGKVTFEALGEDW